MALDATVGGASANSNLLVERADEILADFLNTEAWFEEAEATPDRRPAALITATARLEQESYKGDRATTTQALAFPRTDVVVDGVELADDAMPLLLEIATAKLANRMLAEDLLDETGLEGFERVKVGPIDVTVNESRTGGTLPADVRKDIWPLLRGSPYQFPIVRG